MIVKVKGAKKPSHKKHIISMVEFCAKKLMPKMKNIEVTVKLKNLKGDAWGYCLADPHGDDERGDRPRAFEIEVHGRMRLRRILETVAHEMVHAKQYARGELYESTRQSKHRWHGEWLDKDPDYWDQPWEIEAHGREVGLFVRWAEENNLGKRKWTQDE